MLELHEANVGDLKKKPISYIQQTHIFLNE